MQPTLNPTLPGYYWYLPAVNPDPNLQAAQVVRFSPGAIYLTGVATPYNLDNMPGEFYGPIDSAIAGSGARQRGAYELDDPANNYRTSCWLITMNEAWA